MLQNNHINLLILESHLILSAFLLEFHLWSQNWFFSFCFILGNVMKSFKDFSSILSELMQKLMLAHCLNLSAIVKIAQYDENMRNSSLIIEYRSISQSLLADRFEWLGTIEH